MAKEDSKINVKYGKHGLKKVDDITTFNGKGVETLPSKSQTWLANYGLFVFISRLTANEKNETKWSNLFSETFKWLEDEMPNVPSKSRKLTETEKTLIEKEMTVKTLQGMTTKENAKTMNPLIDKINVEIETLKKQVETEKSAVKE